MNYVSTYIAVMLVYGSFGVTSLVASAHGFPRPALLEHLALVAFGILVAIPIHEAGHILAGAAQGFRCLRFVMGPLEVAPADSGWRIRLVRFRQTAVVYQVPSSFTHFRLQKATCLAAGPCVSLIACLLFTRIALRSTTPLSFWFWTVNAQMCLLGLLELLPLRFGSVEFDGLQLWKIASGGAPVDAMQRDLLADSVNYTPLRPRDWPADLIRRLQMAAPGDDGKTPGPHQRRYCLYMAYIHSLDAGNIPAAWSHLSQLLESWAPGDGPHYALEAAYFLAFHRRDLEGARQWLAREERLPGDSVRRRAEAAVEWAAGRDQQALHLIERAQVRLLTGRHCGNQEFEMDCLNAMREEMAAWRPVEPVSRHERQEHPERTTFNVPWPASPADRPQKTMVCPTTAPRFWPGECEKPAAG